MSDRLTAAEIAACREALSRPGVEMPWREEKSEYGPDCYDVFDGGDFTVLENGSRYESSLIVTAVNALPRLLDEIETLRRERDELAKLVIENAELRAKQCYTDRLKCQMDDAMKPYWAAEEDSK